MLTLLWDASALVKHYVQEIGSDTVDALLSDFPRVRMALTVSGYAETYSVLLRRFNAGIISGSSFEEATAALRNDAMVDPRVYLLSISDECVFASIETMRRHNLNATDSAILTAFAGYLLELGDTGGLLIAADQRLLRAAESEGLATLNPELVSPIEVPALLAHG